MITISFEIMFLHEEHEQSVELFVLVYDAQQIAGILLSKDLADGERGGTRV